MSTSDTPAVEIRGLRKSFGPITAVNGIDLTIDTGSVVALLGANGAGKTTTLDILLGLQQPDAGQVRVNGHTVTRAIRDGLIGAVLQDGELLPGVRVRELLSCMSAMHRDPMPFEEVVDRARISGLMNRYTDRLSGGEAQRVRFALALVPDPYLLVLDEPTAAMDIEARRTFWESVKDLAATGRTIVFSTHYLEEADATAERIVLMGTGEILADGPTSRIRAVASARTVRLTLDADVTPDSLADLPGVGALDVTGRTLTLHSADSDALLRELLARYPDAHDIEVTAASLSEAIQLLTVQPSRTGAAVSERKEPV